MLRGILLIACVIGIGALTGCSSVSTLKLWNSKPPRATAANPVTEIVCLWEPTEGQNANGIPSRGFNGQILFFVRGNDSPVLVDGDVTIYEFDDYGPRESWGTPISEIRVPAHEWNSYLVNGMLGPTHTIFVPYPRTHSNNVNCSLRLKFTPSDGSPVVYSRLTSVTLPGRIREDAATSEIVEPARTAAPGSEATGLLETRNHQTHDPRFATIHRWNQHSRIAGLNSRSGVSAEIVPASFEQAELNDPGIETATAESRLELDAEEPPIRRRFRLEAISGQFSD